MGTFSYATGIDRMWRESDEQYNSKDNVNKRAAQMMESVQEGFPVTTHKAKAHRSTVFIGMTRQKTNAPKLSFRYFTSYSRNFSIEPTPEPELMGMVKSDEVAMDEQGQQMIDPKTQQQLLA